MSIATCPGEKWLQRLIGGRKCRLPISNWRINYHKDCSGFCNRFQGLLWLRCSLSFFPLIAFGSTTSLRNILQYTKFVGRIGHFCTLTFQKVFLWIYILFPPPRLLIVVHVLTLSRMVGWCWVLNRNPRYVDWRVWGLLKVSSRTIPADTEQAPWRFHAGEFLQTQNRPPEGSMPEYSCRRRWEECKLLNCNSKEGAFCRWMNGSFIMGR